MAQSMGANREMIRALKFGFWVREKKSRRAVRWEAARHPDGRESLRGRNWVEVLPHGEEREPERFFAADVELAGPHDYLTYYPAADEPVCGWSEKPGEFCPRVRERAADGNLEPFCRKHQTHIQGEEPHGEDQSGPQGE